ncbi:hypothetical protein [Haloarchaeobius amylolyticus]|uniref:hypothetical protein n=1 Tax=Haloarchaeobius amylolyticus TaxID=1198296 RepID=UPI00226EB33A|nr:hypothetical protein [Haloarchaeobius amylolyticus]
MRILIVDQCSGSKDVPDDFEPFDAADIDGNGRAELLARDGVPSLKARALYTGRQQGYIDNAVDSLRADEHDVDRLFISAGFGLVDEETPLPPYEVTFADMTATEINDRAERLNLTRDLVDHIDNAEHYDAVFFPLGTDYYRALDFDAVLDAVAEDTHVVVFNKEELAADDSRVVSLSARTAEAKEHGTIVVSLKGRYLEYFADHVGAGKTIDSVEDLIEYCTTEATSQQGLDQF